MAFSNIKTKQESGMRIEELTKQNDELVSEAASILHDYNEDLAAAWMAKPFARVNMATAFANGFLKGRDPSDTDPHPHALLVLDVAMQDQRHRKLFAHISDNNQG